MVSENRLAMTTPRKSGPGCFFYGCLTSILLLILVVVGGYVGVRWLFNKQVEKLTDTRPMAMPTVEFTQEEADAIRLRVDDFSKAVRGNQPTEPLVLDGRELNMLIATLPGSTGPGSSVKLSEIMHVDIEGDRLKGAISLPVETIPFRWFKKHKGRYLNGAAELEASLSNGVFKVTLESLTVKGQPLPEQVMAGLRKENLAREFYKSEEGLNLLEKLQDLTVADDRLTIRARGSQ